MRLIRSAIAALAATLFVSSAASAQDVFTAVLDGAQERPNPVVTPGTGFGTVTVFANDTIGVNLSVTSLLANVTVAHIHFGGPNIAGPIVLDFLTAPGSGTVTLGTGSLTIDKVYTGTGTAVNLSMLANNFRNGLPYYLNVHTSVNPGGEVRGNLNAIPEPGTAALAAVAALPLLALVRRRRVL